MNTEAQDIKLQRPQRKDFQVHVVLAPNGQIVDQKDWQSAIGTAEGKDRRQILKDHGWKETTTFNQDAYEEAVKTFREESRKAMSSKRKDLFDKVFEESAVDRHPRLESALRMILPALNDDNPRRVEKALVSICVAVDGLLKSPPQRTPRAPKAHDGKSSANQKPQGEAAPAHA